MASMDSRFVVTKESVSQPATGIQFLYANWVQLEVRVRMRAKDGQMTSALWSCVIVRLQLTKAASEATRTFNRTHPLRMDLVLPQHVTCYNLSYAAHSRASISDRQARGGRG